MVQEGEIVTAQDILVLQALGWLRVRSGWKIWLGIFLLVLLEAAVFSRLALPLQPGDRASPTTCCWRWSRCCWSSPLLARLLIIHPLSAYIIPVAALGMMVAVILNARSALLLVTLLSLNIGLLTDLDMRYALVALLVGALLAVPGLPGDAAGRPPGGRLRDHGARRLHHLLAWSSSPRRAPVRPCASPACGVWPTASWPGCSPILLLLILDTVFNLTTPLRLLELANPAQPLLKRLLQVAPGTYNHSIQMGNLAEAAAEAIGADSSLARVGAYYHDIGKTVRPEYFVENQIYVDNPHDRLSPNLSKLAITAHVRDGEHLARLYGLPQPVVDIIKQHHGTSVLAYFYHKAQQVIEGPVYEESYRYEEQKPRSKEAAIIMLADSVEAAVRAMQNPTRRKIQGVIQEIIKQKIEDGQLDESDLTQGDLHKIRDSFDRACGVSWATASPIRSRPEGRLPA